MCRSDVVRGRVRQMGHAGRGDRDLLRLRLLAHPNYPAMAPSRARVALGACAAYLFDYSTLLAALGSAQAPHALTGQVVRIVDGDTIHVLLSTQVEKVRYIGVNAPELHHPTKGVEPLAREAIEGKNILD